MQSYAERAGEFARSLNTSPARLSKSTSNLFRSRPKIRHGLDANSLTHVLEVNTDHAWVDVEAMTPYDELVKACCNYRVMPCVVPQLKSITIGGAVSGIGIESSSFRCGLVHETMLELDIALPNGDLVTCTPDNEHADLFFGFPNSYGTLGYATRVRARTIPTQPFVALQHERFDSIEAFLTALSDSLQSDADFVDGVAFGEYKFVLTTARFSASADSVSDYTNHDIYYRSLLEKENDYLTINNYIWRWDTDWFWCSKNIGAQNPLIRRLLGKTRLNSRFYTRVMRWNNQRQVLQKLERLFGFQRESIIQDVDIPIKNAEEFLSFFQREIGITPVWMCPVRPHHKFGQKFPLFQMESDTTYVNFGFWDVLRFRDRYPAGHFNRRIESMVDSLGGLKSLYSTSYYPEQEFWKIYGGDYYRTLKSKYDPQGRLPNLYEKCVQAT